MAANVSPGFTCQSSAPVCIDDGTLCRQASAAPGSVGDWDCGESYGRTKILPVPYHVQPTSNQCQSTVLRMYAEYLENAGFGKKGAGNRAIADIYKEINTGTVRPVHGAGTENNHANMMWWLEQNFSPLRFGKTTTKDAATALFTMIDSIDNGFPLMASVSHSTNQGHVILVVGYENYRPDVCLADDNMSYAPATQVSKIVVHDPYGAYDPSLGSKLFGKERWTGGQSLVGGGEAGAGKAVRLSVNNVNRRTYSRIGNFELMTVSSK